MKIEKKFRRIYAIPDIHGRLDLLDKALEILDGHGYDAKQDALVFLGDVIDRGPDSKGVIDLIMLLMKNDPDSVFMVRGNHEDFAVDFYVRKRPHAEDAWAWNGMWQTLDSYIKDTGLRRMTDEHVKFLATLPYSIEIDGFFFSHAPVPRDKARTPMKGGAFPGNDYNVHELTWTYFGPEGERPGALMEAHEGPREDNGTGEKRLIGVCGHIHRGPKVREVRIFPNYRMLDVGSGCFPTGSLAIHECIMNQTLYARPEDLDKE